jgi:hypothetical protein
LASSIVEDGEDGLVTMYECVMLGSKDFSGYLGVIKGVEIYEVESVSGMIIISFEIYWGLIGSWLYMASLINLS